MFVTKHAMTFFSGNIILIVAAVVPALYLLRYVYKHDRLEMESKSLILRLLGMGVVSTFVAIMCERLGTMILSIFFYRANLLYNILLYFVVVGLSEEASKYVVLKRTTWLSTEFNCKFDAIVYAVTVSLGFALWENIGYVFSYGLEVALLRAITAVPGHASFGVFMGVWYGLAKRCELSGDYETQKKCQQLAIVMPALIHGLYDFIASMESTNSTLIFVVFVIIMFIVSNTVVKRLSKTDDYL